MNTITITGNPKYTDIAKKEATEIISNMGRQFNIDVDFIVTIRLHDSRENFNTKLGRITKEWEVGNTNQNNEIDILDPDAFEKQSSHPKSDFSLILKHEIAHIFIKIVSSGNAVPFWLNEGLAMHFANQIKRYPANELFIEDDFAAKISTQHGWNTYVNDDAYRFSCLFVNYLITKYSLENLLGLLKILDKIYYQKTFALKFKKLFGVSLLKAESNFVKSINSY